MPPIRKSLASAGRRIVMPSFPMSSTERLRSLTHGANASARMAAIFVFVRRATSLISELMELLLAGSHGKQTRRRCKPLAACFRQRLALFGERPDPDAVDIGQHPA